MKRSGIYMLLNLVNNKCYVGNSKSLNRRKAEHLRQLRKDSHVNTHLQRAFNKYGNEAFSFIVLEECLIEDLIDRELHWIELKNSTDGDFGYNLTLPKHSDVIEHNEELLEKKRRAAYKQHGITIDYEEWKESIQSEAKRIKEDPKRKKQPVTQIDLKTGEFIANYSSMKECADALGFNKNQYDKLWRLLRGVDKFKFRKSYLGSIFVYTVDYDPEFDYRNYKSKAVREKELELETV